MYAVVRLRGRMNLSGEMENRLKSLGLTKNHSMSIVSKDTLPVIKKVRDFITWGEVSKEILEKMGNKKNFRLNSPKKGFKAIKMQYPKGDLGYRGDKINELIERMM